MQPWASNKPQHPAPDIKTPVTVDTEQAVINFHIVCLPYGSGQTTNDFVLLYAVVAS